MGDGSDMTLIIAASLAAFSLLSFALLRGWEGWLRLRRLELSQADALPPPSAASRRLELIDLKDRVKRLEAIADGVDR
ncbi:MAG TPA: hypothetical protein VEC11_11060 [Allosphingosinicella sp.]|nr:hypothetical protein [Allosphingosinicella sp.]